MVEPVTLGLVVAALVVSATERTGERAIDAGGRALDRMVIWLRNRFANDSATGTEALERVQDAPDSPSRVEELARIVDARAAADTAFESGLRKLVGHVQAAGVGTEEVLQTVTGNQNVVGADIHGSSITVSYSPANNAPFPSQFPGGSS